MNKFAIRWGVPALICAALAWLAVREIDVHQFAHALGLADWRLVLLAGVIAGTLCLAGLFMRLYILLGALPHDRPVAVWELASIYYASSAAHNLLPAPAGEVLRTVQLNRRHGYTVGVLVAAQLIEKVVEALGLGVGTLVVALYGGLPRALAASMYAFAALGVAGAAAALAIGWGWKPSSAPDATTDGLGPFVREDAASPRARHFLAFVHFVHHARSHARNFVRRLGDGLHQLRSPTVWLRALAWSMLSDVANAATVGLCLWAVGVTLPVSAWFLVMLVARAAGIVPSTPGQFGVQEAGVVVALGLLGVDHNRALAMALLHHMAHFLPVTLIGLLELRRQWVPRTAT